MAVLLLLPLSCWAQVRNATESTAYDSIQDQRVRRLERNLGQELETANDRFRENSLKADSLVVVLQRLEKRMGQLEHNALELEDSIASLNSRVELSRTETLQYRRKLKNTLWIAGSALLALSLLLFITVWVHSLKNRMMLERLKSRLSRFKKALRMQRRQILKSTRKEVRRALQSKKRRKR